PRQSDSSKIGTKTAIAKRFAAQAPIRVGSQNSGTPCSRPAPEAMATSRTETPYAAASVASPITNARRQEVGARSAKVSRNGSPRAITRTMSNRTAATEIAAIAVEYLKK